MPTSLLPGENRVFRAAKLRDHFVVVFTTTINESLYHFLSVVFEVTAGVVTTGVATVVVDLSVVTVAAFAAGTAPGAVTVAAPTLAEDAGPASATTLTAGTAAKPSI